MGCFQSKEEPSVPATKEREVTHLRKPIWKSEQPMTAAQLKRKRDEFWDTQPYYGGSKEIWDVLKAACASDPAMAKVLLDAADVKVMRADMSICYDARGFRYELPQYVLADPSNLEA